MAAITGKLVAELASGRATSIDIGPFRPDRF
jgi:glycine/D-amino acid oxidase-like deaminating enzyme